MIPVQRYKLVTRKPIDLLIAMIKCFCGDALLSLEGDLSRYDFQAIENSIFTPTSLLTRQTISPLQDFVILPLEDNTQSVIQRNILPQIGLSKRILHVQIAKKNELIFASYDCFHVDCVWVSSQVSEQLLQSLVSNQAIWSFSARYP
jgi:hypothetical protein